jgi:L-amino acid N-acyltransferase YncA
MNTSPNIRFASISDLATIVAIYNQAIQSKSVTGDMEAFTVEERVDWFNKFNADTFPIYVIEVEEMVIGYATLSPYRFGRKALNKTAEISYYINYSWHGKGMGSALVSHVLSDCKRLGKETLLAILLDINTGSTGLLRKFKFEQWGHLPNVADFNGVKSGHFIYGLQL